MFLHRSVLRGPNAAARAPSSLRTPRRPSQRTSRLGVEVLEDRRLLSVAPSLLADLRVGESSNPAGFVELDGVALFSANDGTHGRALWKTDGTNTGTVLVKDINPNHLTDVNGTVFFTAGVELWKSDGTEEGTVLVKDLGSTPNHMTNVDGALFIAIGGRLWTSDGTEAGTVLLKVFQHGYDISDSANAGGTLYLKANDGVHGRELWKSDGTEEGTVLVKDIWTGPIPSGPTLLTDVEGTLFFIANDGVHGRELWRSDGSEEGTVLVKDIAPGDASSGSSPTTDVMVNMGGTLFFGADDGTHGKELWKSDGTEAGTVPVKDINPGEGSSLHHLLSRLSIVEGSLFFWANDGIHGYAVWKSDGTTAGTVMVKDILQGDDGALLPLFAGGFTSYDGEAFFNASNDTSGFELWRSDGTAQGTVLVKEIASGISGGNPVWLTTINDKLVFQATDRLHGSELWRSDGTEEGTVLVKDIHPGTTESSQPHSFTAVGSLTYFLAGQELWQTDGTEAGTYLAEDLYSLVSGADPQFLTNVNGVLYFTAWDLANWDSLASFFPPLSLYKSDGTPEGTVRIKEILPADRDNHNLGPRKLINANGTLFFSVERKDDSQPGRDTSIDLWTSDGTEEGTLPIADNVSQLTNVNGTVYFSRAYRLWKTDGTVEGTVLVDPGGIYVNNLYSNIGGTLFFSASDLTHRLELWKSDGTEEGTVLVKDINPGAAESIHDPDSAFDPVAIDGSLYFIATDGTHGDELWKSDGTEEGTVMVKDIGPGNTRPKHLTNVGGTLYFQANDGAHGNEWWTSDGTEAGTVLLKDINPGAADGADSHIPLGNSYTADVGGTFYFVAYDGTEQALWMSDGTEAGTVLVDNGGAAFSNPDHLANAGGILYFAADDETHGTEPWMIAPDVVPALFYGDSAFDSDAAFAPARGPLATDKLAYSAGSGAATFENVSSYVHGINGITVDIGGEHGPLTADDFAFRTGTNNAPDTWAVGPPPSDISVLPGAGVAGMDRVQIVWPDGAIINTWLQVLVKGNDEAGGFNTNTGLESSTIFYFGNLVGDTGNDPASSVFMTDSSDEIAARNNQGLAFLTASRYDFNRDLIVDATDQIIARNSAGFLNRLDILPGAAEVAPEPDDGAASAVAAALAAPKAEGQPEFQPATPSIAHRHRAAAARPARELQRAALHETTRAPARFRARNPASVDLALDEELLDSLLPDAAAAFAGR